MNFAEFLVTFIAIILLFSFIISLIILLFNKDYYKEDIDNKDDNYIRWPED